jgi:hypothetical protein
MAETRLRLRALARQPGRAPSRGNAQSRQLTQLEMVLTQSGGAPSRRNAHNAE